MAAERVGLYFIVLGSPNLKFYWKSDWCDISATPFHHVTFHKCVALVCTYIPYCPLRFTEDCCKQKYITHYYLQEINEGIYETHTWARIVNKFYC